MKQQTASEVGMDLRSRRRLLMLHKNLSPATSLVLSPALALTEALTWAPLQSLCHVGTCPEAEQGQLR
jgi:hypothetical protein